MLEVYLILLLLIPSHHDAKELRVKESDRLQAIADGLRKINIQHELYEDGIRIIGSEDDISVCPEIDSHGDHRIAMSFLIASLRSKNGIYVKDCANIFTSFPNFIEVMSSLGIPSELITSIKFGKEVKIFAQSLT